MSKKLILVLSILSLVFIYGCSSGYNPNIQGQPVGNDGNNRGNLAPDFTVTTIDGKTVSLSELSSEKPTVLYFFATWCPNCARDLAAVKDVYPKYQDKINFLAIDMDLRESEAQIASFRQRMGVPTIQFAAGQRSISADYNVVYTTTKFFIGTDGTILNKGVGGIDKNTWEQVFQAMSQ